MSNNGPRYQARQGANSHSCCYQGANGHSCCYDAHVVDTNRLDLEPVGWEPVVCECEDIETAIAIADALNARAMA